MAIHISIQTNPTQQVTPPTGLFAASRRWEGTSLLEFLRLFPDQPRVYWRSQGEWAAYAGVGAAAILTASGADRFDQIREQSQSLFARVTTPDRQIPGLRPRLFGGFSYLPSPDTAEVWSEFPSALFILPRYLLTDLGGHVWLTVNRVGEADGEDAESAALNDVFHLVETHHSKRNGHHAGSASQLTPNYLTGHKEWANMVTEATTRIGRGELQKVVLARAAEVNAQQPIDPLAALGALGERYSACHRFLIEPAPGHAFFGATPELLAQVDGDHIATAALAGSTRRGESAEEDAALGRALLANPKERHEHALVVDSIRDSLADLTDELRVDAEPSPRHLHNIQHLHTGIDGTLAAGVDALDVVEALHPTPALGGSPRDAALDLIARLEGQGRGWYGGPVGWLDAEGNGTFVVAIRSAVSAGNTARLYAGAGIVGDSQPDAEWQETALKFRPLLEALTPSPSPSGRGEQNGGEA